MRFPLGRLSLSCRLPPRPPFIPFSCVPLGGFYGGECGQKGTQQQQQRQQFRQRQACAGEEARERSRAETQHVSSLPTVNSKAAGADIGSRTHWICVDYSADANDDQLIREFSAYTDGLRAIVAWLREHGVTTVAMESTGIYWIPLFELLVDEGFEVFLVDPSYTKQVRGRPKTDRRDCQWIDRLHSVGLLSAAYRPDAKICAA